MQAASGFDNGCTLLDLYAAEGVNACGGFATRVDTLLVTGMKKEPEVGQ